MLLEQLRALFFCTYRLEARRCQKRRACVKHANPLQQQVIAPRQLVPFLPHVLESVFVFSLFQFT